MFKFAAKLLRTEIGPCSEKRKNASLQWIMTFICKTVPLK